MKFIFGLGNPGKDYTKTRHNAGYLFIDHLISELFGSQVNLKHNNKLEADLDKVQQLVVAKPAAFMNQSGRAVRKVVDYYDRVETVLANKQLIVAHDDLDIKLGNCKLQFGTGPKVHNGLQSIYQAISSDQFWHLRLGIDARHGDRTIPGDKYVLSNFFDEERAQFDRSLSQALALLEQQNLI